MQIKNGKCKINENREFILSEILDKRGVKDFLNENLDKGGGGPKKF
jgi:hypothetical protein